MARKVTQIVPVTLRIREGLRRLIEKAAKANEVSSNQEMTNRLEQSFEAQAATELSAIVAEAKDAFSKLHGAQEAVEKLERANDIWSQIGAELDLVLASQALLLQLKRLPEELLADAEFKASVDRVTRAMQRSTHAVAEAQGSSPKPPHTHTVEEIEAAVKHI